MKRRLLTAIIPVVLAANLGACSARNNTRPGAPVKPAKIVEDIAPKTATPVTAAPTKTASSTTMPYAPLVEPVPDADSLYITRDGETTASVVVMADTVKPADGQPDPHKWERAAANDLVKYIEMMSGVKPNLVMSNAPATGPVIYVGRAALAADPSLQDTLDGVTKKNPVVRADAIVMRRNGENIYLVGSNDESHYFAVSQLLQNWGCRWYMPTAFGECIPEKKDLWVDKLNLAYAPPFEMRHYWLSWDGDTTGMDDFQRRNFMVPGGIPGMGHALGQYTAKLSPDGSAFKVSFSDPKTADAIVKQIGPDYAAGKDISLAIEDGNYVNDSPSDKALITEYDKYTLKPSLTDAMLTLYNNVGKILLEKYPNSHAKIGGMAYANVTLPPKKVTTLEPNVVMWIAPIDIDPNHGMDDPKSPPRREYRAMMEKWAKLSKGNLAVYDYDQGMLVWRDMPNPSQQAFARDVKYYAKAGILGIGTESRGAMATTVLNLFFRGQLMWNPNASVPKLQNEFYNRFYGPAAAPMAAYWNAIFDAWANTGVTEHEFMAAPAIYTAPLISRLQKSMIQAEAVMQPLQGQTGRNDKLYQQRVQFTRHSFDVIQKYMAMVRAAAADNNYAKAAGFGTKALAAREALTTMNGTFTTYKVIGENGSAWFPGDVDYMKELAALTDGTKGTLIAQTPLNWAWRRSAPIPAGWEYKGMEGGTPQDAAFATQAPTPANKWQSVRTDLYLQGQGILNPDGQSFTGHYWYQTSVNLDDTQIGGKPHLMFPGIFNEAWLYVNGQMVAHRTYNEPWWLQDYKFQWDVDLTGKLQPGKNVIAVRGLNPHHFGGIFRRPFLYQPKGG